MLRATAAPTPTLFASSASLSAFARSSSLFCAFTETFALLAVTLAPAPTTASVWSFVTMLIATAPAMPTSVLAAPAPAFEMISCSASRKSVPSVWEPSVHGRSVPCPTVPVWSTQFVPFHL
jgi:hypothetical protein